MCIVTSDPVSRASAGQRERSSRLRVSEIESSRELHVVTRGNQICLRVAHCVMPGPVGIPTLDRVAWPKFGLFGAPKRLLSGLPTLTVVAGDALMGRERSDAADRPGINWLRIRAALSYTVLGIVYSIYCT